MIRVLSEMLVVALLGLVMGCQGAGGAGQNTGAGSVDGTWTLARVQGEIAALPENTRNPEMVISEEGHVTGTAGINRISGALDRAALSTGAFRLGPVVSTRMGGSAEAMAFEQRYLELLARVRRYQASGNSLTLLDDAGREILTYTRAK